MCFCPSLASSLLAFWPQRSGAGEVCARTAGRPFCSNVGSQNPRHYRDKFITSDTARAARCSRLTRAGFLRRSTSCLYYYLNLLVFKLHFRDMENSHGFEDLANLEPGTSRFTKAILSPCRLTPGPGPCSLRFAGFSPTQPRLPRCPRGCRHRAGSTELARAGQGQLCLLCALLKEAVRAQQSCHLGYRKRD